MFERPDLERRVAERDLGALAAARGDRHHLVGGEFALGKDVQHLAAHIAGGAYDRDLEAHRHVPALEWSLPGRRPRRGSFGPHLPPGEGPGSEDKRQRVVPPLAAGVLVAGFVVETVIGTLSGPPLNALNA